MQVFNRSIPLILQFAHEFDLSELYARKEIYEQKGTFLMLAFLKVL
jgi:hypothetical protein